MGNGLYNAAYEHDACGVGMVVNIHGNKSHDLVDNALRVLENMRHRGAEGADNKTGDGAGIMLQIPHEFILLQGIPVPEKGKYGTGLVFLPKDEERQQGILSIMIEEIEREGLQLMHLRNVPTNPACLGESALATEPAIRQLFITGVTDDKVPVFERTLYIIRKRIEKRIHDKDFYICSLSNKNIVYKGMLSSMQVRQYFPDLTNTYFTSGLALVHSRFSTNTFPTWSLAQPIQHQHLPHLVAGTTLPPAGTQRRDKHHTRQQGMDAGKRERTLKQCTGRHQKHIAYNTARHV